MTDLKLPVATKYAKHILYVHISRTKPQRNLKILLPFTNAYDLFKVVILLGVPIILRI